jgi:hypothetical protein
MLAPLLLAYGLLPGVSAVFKVTVEFDGYLPLLGGKEGTAVVRMTVPVQGVADKDPAKLSAQSEIETFSISLNGAELPFTAQNVRGFFPKSTVRFLPYGKFLETDAPVKKLPVRLPGLDPQRFADITFLPLEFPPGGIEIGTAYRFEKPFSGQKVTYSATPVKIDEKALNLKIALSQEDEAGSLTGEGAATFDRARGVFRLVEVSADSVTKDSATVTRHLKTKLKIELVEPK